MNVKLRLCHLIVASLFCLLISGPAMAHFGIVIPDQSIITQKKKDTNILLGFTHPFENHSMNLEKPKQFFVQVRGAKTDLLGDLTETQLLDHKAWTTSYDFKRPGVYQFAMEPTPYWEPAEDVFIIHYTKVVIPVCGDDEGWDESLGLPTEIVPMLRPFGNYAGNSFTGQVMVDGKPSANAEIEVEYYNPDTIYSAPSDYHVTQVIVADANGVFTFTCPLSGWWGFAALTEADYTIKTPEGEDKGVELGAVFWTYFNEFTKN